LRPGGEQELRVIMLPLKSISWEWLGPVLGSNEFGRSHYLKTQMSFGWDFAPRLVGVGIWDRIYIYEAQEARVRDVFVKPSLDGAVEVQVEVEGGSDAYTVSVEIDGESFKMEEPQRSESKQLTGGSAAKVYSFDMRVPDPKLWWPWDMGEQDLYRVRVNVCADGACEEAASDVFGIREISWGPNPGAPPRSAAGCGAWSRSWRPTLTIPSRAGN